jgi:hypothetical protein
MGKKIRMLELQEVKRMALKIQTLHSVKRPTKGGKKRERERERERLRILRTKNRFLKFVRMVIKTKSMKIGPS